MELQVVVKILLENTNREFLLLQRNQATYADIEKYWDIPGGRIEVGTPLLENLAREVFEETKLPLTSTPKLVYAQDIIIGNVKHVVRLTYRATTEGTPILDTHENISYKWFSLEQMRTEENLDAFVKDILDKGIL
jgi:8-oxo-dGTP pyrophosphatase MutT (NUDIX family)